MARILHVSPVLLAFLVRRNTCGLDLLTTFALDLFHLYFVLKGIKHPIFGRWVVQGVGGRFKLIRI